jgi:hypothetical protein
VQKCEHLNINGNITPVETIPGIREGGTKESSGCELKNDIFDTLYYPFQVPQCTSTKHNKGPKIILLSI